MKNNFDLKDGYPGEKIRRFKTILTRFNEQKRKVAKLV